MPSDGLDAHNTEHQNVKHNATFLIANTKAACTKDGGTQSQLKQRHISQFAQCQQLLTNAEHAVHICALW